MEIDADVAISAVLFSIIESSQLTVVVTLRVNTSLSFVIIQVGYPSGLNISHISKKNKRQRRKSSHVLVAEKDMGIRLDSVEFAYIDIRLIDNRIHVL